MLQNRGVIHPYFLFRFYTTIYMVYKCEIMQHEQSQWYRNGVPVETVPSCAKFPPGNYYVQFIEKDDIVYINRLVWKSNLDHDPIQEFVQVMSLKEKLKRMKDKPRFFFYKLIK